MKKILERLAGKLARVIRPLRLWPSSTLHPRSSILHPLHPLRPLWPSTLDPRPSALLLVAVAIVGGITACRTIEPWPPPRLDRGDWTVRQGQALWKPDRAAAPIAGDFLYATNRTGQVLVQFTKLPFPSILAEIKEAQWQMVYFPRKQVRQGRLPAPPEIIWLQVPSGLAGEPLPKPWQFERTGLEWRLENGQTGEALNGYFN